MSLTRDFCLFITVDIFCNCALFDEPLRVYIIFTVERIIHYCRPIKSNTSRSEMRKKKLVGITQRRIDRYRTSSHICCRPVVVVVFVFNSIPIELLAIQYRRYEFFFSHPLYWNVLTVYHHNHFALHHFAMYRAVVRSERERVLSCIYDTAAISKTNWNGMLSIGYTCVKTICMVYFFVGYSKCLQNCCGAVVARHLLSDRIQLPIKYKENALSTPFFVFWAMCMATMLPFGYVCVFEFD